MKRLLIAAAALASLAGPVLAGDSDYQEGSASRDYGYVGYTPRHGEGWSSYRGSYGYGSYGYDGYGYGGRSPSYGYRSYAPPSGYGRSYGDGSGYGYGYAERGYERGRWEGRYRGRRHRCGCDYYDDDYR